MTARALPAGSWPLSCLQRLRRAEAPQKSCWVVKQTQLFLLRPHRTPFHCVRRYTVTHCSGGRDGGYRPDRLDGEAAGPRALRGAVGVGAPPSRPELGHPVWPDPEDPAPVGTPWLCPKMSLFLMNGPRGHGAQMIRCTWLLSQSPPAHPSGSPVPFLAHVTPTMRIHLELPRLLPFTPPAHPR